MVCENFEGDPKQEQAEKFDGADNGTGFQVHYRPVLFVGRRGVIDERDGSYGTIGLLLFEHSAKSILASITVQKEQAGLVLCSVPTRESQDSRVTRFLQELSYDVVHRMRKIKRAALFQKRSQGSDALRKLSQELTVVGETTEERT